MMKKQLLPKSIAILMLDQCKMTTDRIILFRHGKLITLIKNYTTTRTTLFSNTVSKVIGSKPVLSDLYKPTQPLILDCSLRIKFYTSKFLDKVISFGIKVRVNEYTRRAILKFLI